MKSGKVKFYDTNKAYGFIIPDGGGKEIFFHKSGLNINAPMENDRVCFEERDGKKGLEAFNIESE